MIVGLILIVVLGFGIVMRVQRDTARTELNKEKAAHAATKTECGGEAAQVEILLKAIDRMYAVSVVPPVHEPEVPGLRALPPAAQDGARR